MAGASTDLSNARDTSAIEAIDAIANAAPKKRSPMIYALPIVALVIGGGAVFGIAARKNSKADGTTPPGPSSSIVVAPDNATAVSTVNTTLPPASAAPSTAPSSAPSSEPSAKVVTMPSAKAIPSGGRPRPNDQNVATPPASANVLKTGIKE